MDELSVVNHDAAEPTRAANKYLVEMVDNLIVLLILRLI